MLVSYEYSLFHSQVPGGGLSGGSEQLTAKNIFQNCLSDNVYTSYMEHILATLLEHPKSHLQDRSHCSHQVLCQSQSRYHHSHTDKQHCY